MSPRIVRSLGNFFFSFFSTLILFTVLPYLTSYMPDAYAGLVVAAGALLACCLFPLLPRLTSRHGAQPLALVFAITEIIALLALAVAPGAVTASIAVAVIMALQPFLAYALDLLLESTVIEEGTTGRVRALFLTAWNVAALAAPLLMGDLLASSEAYDHVFLAAAASLTLFVVLLGGRKLPNGQKPELVRLGKTLGTLVSDRDTAAVLFGHLLLYFFFIWAPLYTPFFLHAHLGISWSEIGWLFSFMLLPYVLIQYPAGFLADRFWGDKELMFGGFLLAGGALAAFGLFTPATPLFVIAAVLIASRIGSALIETMTEGHFFRRVSEKNVNAVSVFRGIWPLSEFLAPVIGSVILVFGSYELFFLVAGGFIALAGAGTTLFIKDFNPASYRGSR
jgi:MFS family permease